MKRILSAIAGFCYRHSTSVLIAVGLITVVSTYYMMQIKISTNNFDLLPQNSKLIKEFWEVNEDFGAQETHILLIETNDSLPAEPEIIRDYAERLDAAFMASGLVKQVNYRITDDQKSFVEDFFIRNALLYLSPQDLDSVVRRLDDANI
ncbi:MAG TPA: hypothetical protein PKW36_14330, partial [bacterium]|nr:hypothetical protein [bacterium]